MYHYRLMLIEIQTQNVTNHVPTNQKMRRRIFVYVFVSQIDLKEEEETNQ